MSTQDFRVAFWGYSADAHACFWSAYTQKAYAPELKSFIVGWAGGRCPVNLEGCALRVKNIFAAGFIVGIMTGLANAYADLATWLKEHFNARGSNLFASGQKC